MQLEIKALLTLSEMTDLFEYLGEFKLYNVSSVFKDHGFIDQVSFLNRYQEYLEGLKRGEVKAKGLSPALSYEPLIRKEVGECRYINKAHLPVVQMRHHTFILQGKKYLPMVNGASAVSWGVCFSFPRHAMDESGAVMNPYLNSSNGPLFSKIQKWIRRYTKPVCFVINEEKVNFPMRIGKKVDWTNHVD